MTTTDTTAESDAADHRPVWNAEKMIYEGAVIPGAKDTALLDELLRDGGGSLRVFGYGSLTWNPGSDGPLTRATSKVGRAVGWKRCWAQASADHRGTVRFPGIVCTLLSDREVREIQRHAETLAGSEAPSGTIHNKDEDEAPSMAEGMIFTVPPELVEECVAELDFREKGGYGREIIDVVEADTGNKVKALLYRGTPDNPAFWSRPLLDLHYAAATMAVAIGPSGRNDFYLYSLDDFLTTTSSQSDTASATSETVQNEIGDLVTRRLANLAWEIQRSGRSLCFLVGCGSNQHDQLLLRGPPAAGDEKKEIIMSHNPAALVNGDEAHVLKEMVLEIAPAAVERVLSSASTAKHSLPPPDAPHTKALYAGGGHSGLLLEDGSLYLWGWNENGQLGRPDSGTGAGYRVVPPLSGIKVERAALGHSHTLVMEEGTGTVFGFGDDCRGQVSGNSVETKGAPCHRPTTPSCLVGVQCVDVAAGLFHSAVITKDGHLVTFGSSKECLVVEEKWRPADGARLISVACGQHHTIVLDEYERVWTFGSDNKHGQLGRSTPNLENTLEPGLVEGFLGSKGSGCRWVDCGWSHNVVLVQTQEGSAWKAHGWGRNDKGQLGTRDASTVARPQELFLETTRNRRIHSVSCGSEFVMMMMLAESSSLSSSLEQQDRMEVWGCGWNEHGNLGVGQHAGKNVWELTPTSAGAAKLAKPPSAQKGPAASSARFFMAAGGAHVLVMKS